MTSDYKFTTPIKTKPLSSKARIDKLKRKTRAKVAKMIDLSSSSRKTRSSSKKEKEN